MRSRSIVLVALIVITKVLAAQVAQPVRVPAPATAELPVTSVALFSSGVGYFEHSGTVRGTTSAQFRFRTAQVNDILKSLVLEDLDGGRVSTVTFASQDPLAKTLHSFQVDITGNPSVADLLTQLRGARVTLAVGAEQVSGTILGVETRAFTTERGERTTVSLLNVVSAGTIRSIPSTSIQSFTLDDAALQRELMSALGTLSQARDQDRKPVTVAFTGTGQRRVRVGYVVETPVWKTSYRLLLDDSASRMQGWAIVENQTESDWNNVSLSLVSGRPLSFVMDLYQPLYATRPTVVSNLFASLRPQLYESGISARILTGVVRDGGTGTPVPGATVRIPALNLQVVTDDRGAYRLAGVSGPGPYAVDVSRAGYSSAHREGVMLAQATTALDVELFPGAMALDAVTTSATSDPTTGTKMPMAITKLDANQMPVPNFANGALTISGKVAGVTITSQSGTLGDWTGGVTSQAQTGSLGELFQYVVKGVTLPRQKSAMIPIVTDSIAVERVSIYNASVLASNPLNGARIHNTTDKALLQGPVTVIDRGGYGGDARIDDVPAGQERLLSFGVDLETRIDNTLSATTDSIVGGRIVKGVLLVDRRMVSTRDYRIDNRGKTARTIIVEHPVRGGWQPSGDVQPFESTPSLRRYRIVVPPGQITTLHVSEESMRADRVALAMVDTEAVMYYLRTGAIPDEVRDAIAEVLRRRQAVTDADDSTRTRTEQIDEINVEQGRIRENMQTVRPSTDYYKRLLAKLGEQETLIERLQTERSTFQTAGDRARKALESYLSTLTR